jgi:hypothetical protein
MMLERAYYDPLYKQYEALLLLDADAMIYDFSRDIADLLPRDKLLVAHKVKNTDSNYTANINLGVTLWNLQHPVLPIIVEKWKKLCLQRILNRSNLDDNDQVPLQKLLNQLPDVQRQKLVLAVSHELGYGRGRLVKHFIRPNKKSWNQTGLESRIQKIRTAIAEICTAIQPPPVFCEA